MNLQTTGKRALSPGASGGLAAQGTSDAGTGGIVNIASILGLRAGGALWAYATTTADLVQMTKAMALE